jgi:DNA-binding NarL/FixJ family response regulator
MYALKSARLPEADYAGPRGDAPGGPGERAFSELPAVLYLDPRAFTRDCIGGWLRNSLNGFEVCVMSDPEQIETMAIAGDRVRAVIINADPERLFSATVARLLTRLRELLPEIRSPSCRTTKTRRVSRRASSSACAAISPPAWRRKWRLAPCTSCASAAHSPLRPRCCARAIASRAPRATRMIEGFTPRQAQILDCLRPGMANKLVAYELSMCESAHKKYHEEAEGHQPHPSC